MEFLPYLNLRVPLTASYCCNDKAARTTDFDL